MTKKKKNELIQSVRSQRIENLENITTLTMDNKRINTLYPIEIYERYVRCIQSIDFDTIFDMSWKIQWNDEEVKTIQKTKKKYTKTRENG